MPLSAVNDGSLVEASACTRPTEAPCGLSAASDGSLVEVTSVAEAARSGGDCEKVRQRPVRTADERLKGRSQDFVSARANGIGSAADASSSRRMMRLRKVCHLKSQSGEGLGLGWSLRLLRCVEM